jgi:hypothetical protein
MFSENELRFLRSDGSEHGFAWQTLPRGIPPAVEKRILDWRAARAGMVPQAITQAPVLATNDLADELIALKSL